MTKPSEYLMFYILHHALDLIISGIGGNLDPFTFEWVDLRGEEGKILNGSINFVS